MNRPPIFQSYKRDATAAAQQICRYRTMRCMVLDAKVGRYVGYQISYPGRPAVYLNPSQAHAVKSDKAQRRMSRRRAILSHQNPRIQAQISGRLLEKDSWTSKPDSITHIGFPCCETIFGIQQSALYIVSCKSAAFLQQNIQHELRFTTRQNGKDNRIGQEILTLTARSAEVEPPWTWLKVR